MQAVNQLVDAIQDDWELLLDVLHSNHKHIMANAWQ
jgi:hypothetical protein